MNTRADRSGSMAAFLSFLWPGLGQIYRGRTRGGILQAIPVALALLALVILAVGGVEQLAARLLVPSVALGVTTVVGVLGIWRIFSIFDARRRAGAAVVQRPRASLVVALLLSVLVVASHALLGYYSYSFYRLGDEIFVPATSNAPTPAPAQIHTPVSSPSPAPGASGGPSTPSPAPTVVAGGALINVLLVGIDSGSSANTNTDTLMVASFDPRRDQIAMISIPRDTAQVPLYSGGVWNGKINALMHYAETHPNEFPAGGMGTLVREVEYLIGVPVHYYASIELAGFRRLIDEVGGVDVVLDRPISDPTYQHRPGETGFYLEAGPHHLDGEAALAYVRSRHGAGGSDFVRSRRQQQVLLALRHRVRDPQVLLNLPNLLDAVAETVRTDVPLDRAPELLQLVQASQAAEARTIVLAPRKYAQRIPPSEFGGLYGLRLKMDEVAALSVSLWGGESRYAHEPVPATPEPGN